MLYHIQLWLKYHIFAECVTFITLIEKYLFHKCHEIFIMKTQKVFCVAESESSNAIHMNIKFKNVKTSFYVTCFDSE